MTTVMKDSQEGQPECVYLLLKVSVCVSVASFRLGSLRVALEVYRARAINIQLCSSLSLLNVKGGRDFFMLMCDNFL